MPVNKSNVANDPTEVVTSIGRVTIEPMHHLERYWKDAGSPLKWDCLFMLPPWLDVWWSHFGDGPKTRLWVVKEYDMLIGIVPLIVSGDTARLVSDSDLIDYGNFIVAPSREKEFFSALFARMKTEGISRLDIERVRTDSAMISCLMSCSTPLGYHVSCKPVDMLYEMDLPDSWGGYLNLLSGKERHEIRRKLSHLERAGHVGLRIIEDKKDVSVFMDTFIELFRSGREEKAHFMTNAVESFFRSLAERMAGAGLLKLFSLDLNGTPVASAFCFDYNSTVYLYNNSYDRRFSHLSVGLLSKVLSIRESITHGRKKYNFLRGSEPYKSRLGGHPIKLYRCEVILG